MQVSGSIVRADAGCLPLRKQSADCVVTSPPYNAGMPYREVDDALPLGEYIVRVASWAGEIARVLRTGGRVWLNVPQASRCSPVPRGGHRLSHGTSRLGEPAICSETGSSGTSRERDAATAWGSFLSPNAPNIRGRFELILLFFKERWSRGRTGRNDISAGVWGQWTRKVWEMPPVTRRSDHPAPFPEELPRRAILLSTWPGDVVLDPFCGSGTTVRVAKDLGRVGIGCDLSKAYCLHARARCAQEVLVLTT
jgi:site-specific DNA-methyltransferase (adenine-specific)